MLNKIRTIKHQSQLNRSFTTIQRWSASNGMKRINNSGYLAITSALILSFLILAIVSASGSAALFSRDNNLDFELKQNSYFLARACLEYALIKLADSPSYAGNETRDIDLDQCEVISVETSGLNKVIKTRSQVSGATTNLRLTVVTANLSTVSLEEVVSF